MPDRILSTPSGASSKRSLLRTRSNHHVTLALFKNLLSWLYRVNLLIVDLKDCFNKFLPKLLLSLRLKLVY